VDGDRTGQAGAGTRKVAPESTATGPPPVAEVVVPLPVSEVPVDEAVSAPGAGRVPMRVSEPAPLGVAAAATSVPPATMVPPL
jgi:hypothetical protein